MEHPDPRALPQESGGEAQLNTHNSKAEHTGETIHQKRRSHSRETIPFSATSSPSKDAACVSSSPARPPLPTL